MIESAYGGRPQPQQWSVRPAGANWLVAADRGGARRCAHAAVDPIPRLSPLSLREELPLSTAITTMELPNMRDSYYSKFNLLSNVKFKFIQIFHMTNRKRIFGGRWPTNLSRFELSCFAEGNMSLRVQ